MLALTLAYLLVEDPEYLKQERAELRNKPLNFDYIGLGLLVLIMSCWEVLLSKGQEWDWLGDPFGRIQTLMTLFVLGLCFLIFWELRIDSPLVNLRVLGERNLRISCIMFFCAYGVLYGSSFSLPAMLQALFGYDAFQAGLVLSPGGITSISALIIVGIALGRGVDARWLIAAGLVFLAASNWWMAQLNLQVSPGQVVGPRMMLTGGLGLMFAPLTVAAFKYTPQHLRGAAVGLASLLRNEGGSVGTSMAQTIQERRDQFHTSRVGEFLDPFNPAVASFLDNARSVFYEQTGDLALSQLLALQRLEELRAQQASSLAYFDVFYVFAVLGFALIFMVPFMKRSVAEKGEHVGGE